MRNLFILTLLLFLLNDLTAQRSYIPSLQINDDAGLVVNDDLSTYSARKRGRSSGAGINGTKSFLSMVMAMPAGDLGEGLETGYGFEGDVIYFFDHFGVGLGMGFYYFNDKNETSDKGIFEKSSMIPIRALGMYVFGEDKWNPYAGLAVGYYNMEEIYGAKGQWGLAPMGGLIFNVSESFHLHLKAEYNILSYKQKLEELTVKRNLNHLNLSFGIGYRYIDTQWSNF